MKEKPQQKYLPLTVSEYPDEEWLFIHTAATEAIKSKGWEDEFLYYEMARQLELEQSIRGDLQDFLVRVTKGHFPKYPFLLIPEDLQEKIIRKLNEEGSLFHVHYRLLSSPRPIQWTAESPFHEEFERRIEDAAWNAAAEKAQEFDGLDPEDFMPGSCPGDRSSRNSSEDLAEYERQLVNSVFSGLSDPPVSDKKWSGNESVRWCPDSVKGQIVLSLAKENEWPVDLARKFRRNPSTWSVGECRMVLRSRIFTKSARPSLSSIVARNRSEQANSTWKKWVDEAREIDKEVNKKLRNQLI